MKKYSHETLIEIIQSFIKEHNRVPKSTELSPRLEIFRLYFGSFGAALTAAGVHPPKPLTIMKCITCQQAFTPKTKKAKFCSRSCSVTHNNRLRVHSDESRRKRSITRSLTRVRYSRVYFPICGQCGERFTSATPRKLCSSECEREQISIRAVNNPNFGGNQSRKFVLYQCKDGSVCRLDSTWEGKLASVLDGADIHWQRPTVPQKYVDGVGRTRRYYPDFFIPDLNLYVDTRNPWRLREDTDKLTRVVDQNDISLLILSNVAQIKIEHIISYPVGLHVVR